MKKSVAYVYAFLVFMITIAICIYSFLFPNMNNDYYKITLIIFGFLTSFSFLLSWMITPGYIEKKAEGEFLLILTKFDPKSLCPFCEVV